MSTVKFENVTKRYPNGFEAVTDLDLDVVDGELLVVVGPSGCGKSTTLRMLAGLESVSQGSILIDDERVNSVAARNRDIAMVFQSYALYPHLTVGGNLAYPLKLQGCSKADVRDQVAKVSRQLRLDDLLDRKPRELSGGQRQRVAMGRAMVRDPRVFLMDEPLSNLDAKLRVSMRAEVSELQRSLETTMFYVTHDQIEAMTLGHRVAVMRDGVLQQCAPPIDLYRKPANTFVATFIGAPPMNLIAARIDEVSAGTLEVTSGTDRYRDSAASPGRAPAVLGRDVTLGFRPEDISILPSDADYTGFEAKIRLVEVLGSEQIIHVSLPKCDVVKITSEDSEEVDDQEDRILVKFTGENFDFRVGDNVALRLDLAKVRLFDAGTGNALEGDLK